MKKISLLLATVILTVFIVGCASSNPEVKAAEMQKTKKLGRILTKMEVKKIFSGKTVDIDAVNGKHYRLTHGVDGSISGTFKGSWYVNDDGTKCIKYRNGESCVLVVKTSSGEYIAVKDGKKVSSFKF